MNDSEDFEKRGSIQLLDSNENDDDDDNNYNNGSIIVSSICNQSRVNATIAQVSPANDMSIDSFITGPNQKRRNSVSSRWRFASKLDIFHFMPVPITQKVSTQVSQVGTIFLLLAFFTFVCFELYSFFFTAAPRVNTYTQQIDLEQTYTQDFAFGFYTIGESSNLIDDPSLFTYILDQQNIMNKPGTASGKANLSKVVEYVPCRPSWSPVQIDMFCPKNPLLMQGMTGRGYQIQFPRLRIMKCNPEYTPGVVCNEEGARKIFPQGRLMIFIKKNEITNYSTGKVTGESGTFYYYFIVPDLYERAEITIQSKVIILHPDYGTQFTKKSMQRLFVYNNRLQVSDVSAYFPTNNNRMLKPQRELAINPAMIQPYFQWAMMILPIEVREDVIYQNLQEVISVFGGLWGVLSMGFALVFLAYNSNVFYTKNKHWENFDEIIKVNRTDSIIQLVSDKVEPQSSRMNSTRGQKMVIGINNETIAESDDSS